jgi:hypothetical protein
MPRYFFATGGSGTKCQELGQGVRNIFLAANIRFLSRSENPCSQSAQELEGIDAGVVAIAEGDPVSIVANWFNSLDTQRPCLVGR